MALGEIMLKKTLGKGAHGKVLLCSMKADPEIDYALKIISKKHMIQQNQLQHTLAEKQILSGERHPFLISIR